MLLGRRGGACPPRVHFDAVVGCEPKRVVEQDLGWSHVNLDRRRNCSRPMKRRLRAGPDDRGPPSTAGGLFQLLASITIVSRLDSMAPGQASPSMGQQDPRTERAAFWSSDSARPHPRSRPRRARALRHASRRGRDTPARASIERGRKLVLGRRAGSRQRRRVRRSKGDLAGQVPEGPALP